MRQLANLSKKQLIKGEKPLTYTHIGTIEKGQASPTLMTLQKIARALKLPLVFVFNGEHADPNSVILVSTPEFSQELLSALHREDMIQLVQLGQQLSPAQMKIVLNVAASLAESSSHHEEKPPS
ncbi:hypothetical protein KDK_70250 [Dictyobacter kobayashii]|uniref:HTH cro/C1-type domain-containing protein n=1 Tax=Dictyobacter kobayashii TaxID=2014872 RepID=A0A402AVY8_9CHLR|nr:hypothetical protein KDK_70250 [Dictyobacter kobayashii]